MNTSSHLSAATRALPSTGRGFSLVELLVVIAVLVILIALTLGVAGTVLTSARAGSATDTIRILDQTVEAWGTNARGSLPSEFVLPDGTVLPAVDGRATEDGATEFDPAWPSLSIYLAAVQEQDTVASVVQAIEGSRRVTFQDEDTLDTDRDFIRIEDPWGNPIRFVHPRFDGGWGEYWDGSALDSDRTPALLSFGDPSVAFRRSWRPFELTDGEIPVNGEGVAATGDADEGFCPGGGTRAYFYSAGPDGDPGTIEDNVYSERPQFPVETQDIRE